jgi:phospholipid/cholesterol/gamma-HCH transport system substrate-binding protein
MGIGSVRFALDEQAGRLMRTRQRTSLRFLAVFITIGAAGIAAALYTVVKERLSLPFTATYDVRAAFSAANGVITGVGQPVEVSGVNVGQVVGVKLQAGQAMVTLQIDRSSLQHVYANADAVLEPVTPLGDMQIDLDPGQRSAGPMPAGGLITIGQTSSPVPLSDLLSTLDADTRDYLTSLIASLAQGTAGRGPDIRRILLDFGPTTADAGAIAQALAQRRTELSQLVHNLAIVTRAAANDRDLATIVVAGDQTLRAVAAQEAPLRQAIAKLPGTLALTSSTLSAITPFSKQLGPTLDALEPTVVALPRTLEALSRLSAVGSASIANGVAPFVTAAKPLTRELAPAVRQLNVATPYLSGTFQVLEYLVNELSYNPDKGDNQGFLFWLSWFVHNLNSVTSFADANGGIGRVAPLSTCYGLQDDKQLQELFNVVGVCPS